MEVVEKKPIKLNMVLNAIKGLMGVLFPLITFPYISRVLGVDNVGRFNFANSLISYFVLIAGLGINTYAVREGARIRNNRMKIDDFASEMFSINILSTIVSYILLALSITLVQKFKSYSVLIWILSIQIAFKTLGIEWIYSIFEDYFYITIRSVFFQLISLVLLFLFVKNTDDVNTYAIIIVISAVGSNILNFIHAKKYCEIRFILRFHWKYHIKSILLMFAMAVTVTLYVSADTTMIGLMCDDHTVGIYSVSTKVYTIVKTILSSVLVVSVPRLSALLGQDKKSEFSTEASEIYSILLTVVLPAIFGIIALRKEVILLISTSDFISATSSLSILSIALLFCLGAWFWGQCILIPEKDEKTVFFATLISAVVNVVLNLVLIPVWKEYAAALTTVIAEGISFVICRQKGKRYAKLNDVNKDMFKVIVGCVSIYGTVFLLRSAQLSRIPFVILSVSVSVLVYMIVEVLLKNDSVVSLLMSLNRKLRRR